MSGSQFDRKPMQRPLLFGYILTFVTANQSSLPFERNQSQCFDFETAFFGNELIRASHYLFEFSVQGQVKLY